MGQSVSAARDSASEPSASFRREFLKIEPVQNVGKKLPGYGFGRLCRYLSPQKAPAFIEFYTGMPERTARHAAADKSDPGSLHLAQIIDSDQGWRALEWIMRDSKQPWWLATKRARKCAAAYEQEREQFELNL